MFSITGDTSSVMVNPHIHVPLKTAREHFIARTYLHVILIDSVFPPLAFENMANESKARHKARKHTNLVTQEAEPPQAHRRVLL